MKSILITPLNWGLGHSTRCIPIIRSLLARGHRVHIGSDGVALALLRREFPDLPSLELPGYNIRYRGVNLVRDLFFQSISMWKALRHERRVVNAYVSQHAIDYIISDNRFGCRSNQTRNIFITHQVQIVLSNSFLQDLVSAFNRFYIRRFDECWIPDIEGPNNLTGAMSARHGLLHVRYLGPLTRLYHLGRPRVRDLLILLSGPEPARTVFEEKLIRQAFALNLQILLVRGRPDLGSAPLELPSHISQAAVMTSGDLNSAIAESKYLLSRTGYTTVMDLVCLQKPAILIPTPGQPEQEYLGETLRNNPLFVIGNEAGMDLAALYRELERKPALERTIVLDNALDQVLDSAGL